MGDITNVPLANPDFVGEANQGALAGITTGQAIQKNNALQSINFGDPGSVDSAIAGLARAGAGEQATALMNLSAARQFRAAAMPAIMARLQGLAPQDQSSDQAQAPSAQAPSQQDAMNSHVGETMGMARQAVAKLQQTPQADRPAVFDQIKTQLVARGVPEQAIDAAGEDLSDAGLQKYGAYLDAHNAATNPAPGQQAPAMPDHPTGYAWASKLIGDETLNDPIVQGMMKQFGFDPGPQIDRAERLMAPTISKQAELAGAGPIATATEQGKAPFEMVHTSINGVPVDMPKSTLLTLQKAGVPGVGVGLSPQQEAEQKARGQGAGSAPYDIVHTTLNGTPVDLPKDSFLKLQKAGTPGLGRDLSPGEREAQTGDAQALVKTVADASDPNRQEKLQKALIVGQQITGLASSINTGKYTEALNQVAQAFPNLKGPKEYANNASLLAQDLSASFQDQLAGMAVPRLNSEAKAITGAIPHNTNPQDQIKLYGASLSAAAEYARAHDQFMVDWANDQSHPRSQAAAQAAWNNGPGRKSLLAYPEFQGVTINGHPAVAVNPQTGYGVFMPGTKQQFTFWAK
jgi:hypothetical protein